jgi:hypothetical protein
MKSNYLMSAYEFRHSDSQGHKVFKVFPIRTHERVAYRGRPPRKTLNTLAPCEGSFAGFGKETEILSGKGVLSDAV